MKEQRKGSLEAESKHSAKELDRTEALFEVLITRTHGRSRQTRTTEWRTFRRHLGSGSPSRNVQGGGQGDRDRQQTPAHFG